MSFFLYRPHINHGEKIVTTDFLIKSASISLPDEKGVALPIDLLNCFVDLTAPSDNGSTIPVAFEFSGDAERFLAPGLAMLDEKIWAYDRALAWRNARVSVARTAIPLSTTKEVNATFQNQQLATIGPEALVASSRHHAAVHPLGNPIGCGSPASLHLSIAGATQADHRLRIVSLTPELVQ